MATIKVDVSGNQTTVADVTTYVPVVYPPSQFKKLINLLVSKGVLTPSDITSQGLDSVV